MSEDVIDLLEAVEIDAEESNRLAGPPRGVEDVPDALVEGRPVGKVGEWIVMRKVDDPGLGDLALAKVAERDDGAFAAAVGNGARRRIAGDELAARGRRWRSRSGRRPVRRRHGRVETAPRAAFRPAPSPVRPTSRSALELTSMMMPSSAMTSASVVASARPRKRRAASTARSARWRSARAPTRLMPRIATATPAIARASEPGAIDRPSTVRVGSATTMTAPIAVKWWETMASARSTAAPKVDRALSLRVATIMRRDAEDDAERDRGNDEVGRPVDVARKLDRRHAEIVHAGDAAADDPAAERRPPVPRPIDGDAEPDRGHAAPR